MVGLCRCNSFLQLQWAGATLQVRGLLTAGASLVVEHRLQGRGLQSLWHLGSVVVAPGIQNTGSVVVVHRLSCSVTCGIFLDHGSNPCLLIWQVDSLPMSHQGSPSKNIFKSHYPEDIDGEGRVGQEDCDNVYLVICFYSASCKLTSPFNSKALTCRRFIPESFQTVTSFRTWQVSISLSHFLSFFLTPIVGAECTVHLPINVLDKSVFETV